MALGTTKGMKCRSYKTTYSKRLGKNVKRCADFAGTRGFSGAKGSTCKRFKTVFSPKLGKKVKRCADF